MRRTLTGVEAAPKNKKEVSHYIWCVDPTPHATPVKVEATPVLYINEVRVSSCSSIYGIDIYMNMTIIMNMNIYITKDNEEQLRGLNEWTMSGLVNYLLTNYFKDPEHNAKVIKERVEKPALKKFPEEMAKPLPPLDAETVDKKLQEVVVKPNYIKPMTGVAWSGPMYRDKKKSKL